MIPKGSWKSCRNVWAKTFRVDDVISTLIKFSLNSQQLWWHSLMFLNYLRTDSFTETFLFNSTFQYSIFLQSLIKWSYTLLVILMADYIGGQSPESGEVALPETVSHPFQRRIWQQTKIHTALTIVFSRSISYADWLFHYGGANFWIGIHQRPSRNFNFEVFRARTLNTPYKKSNKI